VSKATKTMARKRHDAPPPRRTAGVSLAEKRHVYRARAATKNGRTVTLAVAEYEALLRRVEDIEDARDVRLAEAQAGKRGYLPAAAVKRLIAGEHPLRVWREHRGLTLAELAAKAGARIGYVSEIETGKKPGSVRAYRALAGALGLTIEDLLPKE